MSEILRALNRVQEKARHGLPCPTPTIEPPRDLTFTMDLFVEAPSSHGAGKKNLDANGKISPMKGNDLLRGVPGIVDSFEHFTIERLEDLIFVGRKKG